MGLFGKLSATIEIKSNGDLFHDLWRHNPHQVSGITPDKIQSCDLHDGDWGTHGSTIFWKYKHDGKEKVAKEIVEVDEEKKCVTMKVVEGDLLDLYKTFTAHVRVDTGNGASSHFVTWEFEYEKLNDDVEDPISLLQLLIQMTKEIDSHHLEKYIISMGLMGKLSAQIEIRSDGELFYELFRQNPHHISRICPDIIQSVEYLQGTYGSPGSKVLWKYLQGGIEMKSIESVEVDDEKKSVKFTAIDGILLETNNAFTTSVRLDDSHVVTWLLEYEKPNHDTPDPIPLLEQVIRITKYIEAYHLDTHPN
ncbi:MLP-like protein 34 [Andrographis paniculata]|uniref:MLP-like protein 34 n=1 Tax=Andrographis paniculata TaxID=175694 RepID=UPI0021E9634A|nr:MLP-like protein 34 [Andrographis paniculata]